MTRATFTAILLVFALALTSLTTIAQAAGDTPIQIRVKNPDGMGTDGVLLSGGWSLVLEFEIDDAIGIVDEDNKDADETNMALIISDPDGCINMQGWIDGSKPTSAIEGCAGGTDETFIRFSPDFHDSIGISEILGLKGFDLYQTALQNDSCATGDYANLNVQCFNAGLSSSVAETSVGIRTEDSAVPLDGYGYGVNDDFPGLYVWAEIGTGIVADDDLMPIADATGVYRLRNMAGLFNSISYTQLARNNKTSLIAIMNVERGILEPIVRFDFKNVNSSGQASGGGFLRQLDGGPIEDIPFVAAGNLGQNAAYEEVFASLENYEVVVRAAVVEGDATAFIEDGDANGRYNRRDLEMMGHTLLSNVKRYKVRAIQFEALDTGAFECPPSRIYKEVPLDTDADLGVGCSTGSARSVVRRPQ